MWHDPNPKQKKVQRDTGTSVWGDPNAQQVVRFHFIFIGLLILSLFAICDLFQEIRRWKDAEQEDYSHVPCAAPTGGDWSNIPVSSGPVSTNTSPPATAAGWTDSQSAHAVNTANDGSDRWGGSQQTSGWGEPVKVVFPGITNFCLNFLPGEGDVKLKILNKKIIRKFFCLVGQWYVSVARYGGDWDFLLSNFFGSAEYG